MEKQLKRRIGIFILVLLIPWIATEITVTKPSTDYLWWEDILGHIITTALLVVWVVFWYDKIIGNFLKNNL